MLAGPAVTTTPAPQPSYTPSQAAPAGETPQPSLRPIPGPSDAAPSADERTFQKPIAPSSDATPRLRPEQETRGLFRTPRLFDPQDRVTWRAGERRAPQSPELAVLTARRMAQSARPATSRPQSTLEADAVGWRSARD